MIANSEIVRSRSGSAIVLRLQGPLAASSTSRLIEEVGQLLDQPAVLIDMRAVTEVDDVALATMTEYLTRAAVHGPAFAFLTTRDSLGGLAGGGTAEPAAGVDHVSDAGGTPVWVSDPLEPPLAGLERVAAGR